MNTQDTITTVNGVDVKALGAMIEKVREQPVLAQCRFRANNTWITGAHNRTSVQGFYASGGEDQSREQPFVLDSDEPPLLLGENRGANAVEIALPDPNLFFAQALRAANVPLHPGALKYYREIGMTIPNELLPK